MRTSVQDLNTFEVSSSAAGLGNTAQCHIWRDRIYSRCRPVSGVLRKGHAKLAASIGYVKANQWLMAQEKSLKIGRSGLLCTDDDQVLKDYAEAKSKKIEKQLSESVVMIGVASRYDKDRISDYLRAEVEKTGLDYPLPEYGYTNAELKSALARICQPEWWRRQLRKLAAQQFERFARNAGIVSLSGNIYCSDFTVNRRIEQKRRNRRLLESLEAENSDGQVYTLAELSDLSVSNPVNRRHELMTRIRGFEEYAKQHHYPTDEIIGPVRYMALFFTITTPSKFHAKKTARSDVGKRWAIDNPKFNNTDPRQANEYLCDVWAGIRAEWDKNSINPYGFRMAEPHHDGTPHWHLILFFPEHQIEKASAIFQEHALREDGDEVGAAERRTEIVFIDPAKGSAAGYCAKYVAKNIDGFGLGSDFYGREAIKSALRIEAWAATWSIRQFQQIGGPSVTVWREARRIKEHQVDCTVSPEAWPIIDAADAGDWGSYTELMGGAICKRSARPIRSMMITRPDQTKYYEFTEILKGLLVGTAPIVTRTENWTIRPIGNSESRRSEANWSSSLKGFYASPKAA